MIWYLLYPIRGTSQPPRLSANHPIRRAFYRHGKTTAQHWLIAMLVSVAIAMGFSYPTIFLPENPTAGFAAYPHHVWTSAKPVEGADNLVDVEMRQVWVHGNYMKALEKDVLKSALAIQQTLVGTENLDKIPALNEKLRSSTLNWGYHSPLMYWNSSAEMIDRDEDIVRTINDQSRASSSLHVALRPASVFGGKLFDRRHLRAADALILTFMNKVPTGVGSEWQGRMKKIAQSCHNCTLFPSDGDVTSSRVYEFAFVPLSLRENVMLAIAYSLMAAYVFLSLTRLRAFHSRFGLVVTAITQMTCSILASFTICGILKINLSMIPQNAYPFVVLVIGLENMFRLINAIVAYPATMATDQRIANALGDVGPVSVLTAAQNVFILSVLGSVVSPGVAAFCAFACIATLFDAFFLLTFFVAVLNVDIRRLELQDALARSNQRRSTSQLRRKASPPSRHTWFDALVHGRLPFSTRMAGTAVTTTFILSLNHHFFERHEKGGSLRYLLGLARGGARNVAEFDTFTPPPMNATLTPGEWMRMQDFDTAREVMRLAKPGADSFVIRIFAPLVVVLPGADRTGAPLGTEAWTHALRLFAIHNFYPVMVAIVFVVAFVAVLMNFLLYSEAGEGPNLSDERFEEALTVQSVALPHRLDIMKVTGTGSGHIVTVALDRTIAVSLYDRSQKTYTPRVVHSDLLAAIKWPVQTAVLDENSEWLACLDVDSKALIYHVASGTISNGLDLLSDDTSLLFRFARLPYRDGLQLCFLAVTSNGWAIVKPVSPSAGNMQRTHLIDTNVIAAVLAELTPQNPILVLVTADGKIHSYSWDDGWKTISSRPLVQTDNAVQRQSLSMSVNASLGPSFLVICLSNRILILDTYTLTIGRTFDVEGFTNEFQFSVGLVTDCPFCQSSALRSYAVFGRLESTKQLKVVTFSAEGADAVPFCLRQDKCTPKSPEEPRINEQTIEPSGAWLALPAHAVLGLRKQYTQSNGQATNTAMTSLRPRHRRQVSNRPAECTDGEWQAYRYTVENEQEVVPVNSSADANTVSDGSLYVVEPGPVALLSTHSIAVVFGNTVKVIRTSRRGHSLGRSNGNGVERHGTISRRRLTLRKTL